MKRVEAKVLFDMKAIHRIVLEIREQLQREANQSILKREPNQGLAALGGMDALVRFENVIKIRFREYAFIHESLEERENAGDRLRTIRGKLG